MSYYRAETILRQSTLTRNPVPAPLPEGATKPCPVCKGGFFYRDSSGELAQMPHDLSMHGIEGRK